MTASPLANRRLRKNFGSMHKIVDIPDLIGMQRESYERFLQMNVQPDNRTETGLQAVFKSVFPIKDLQVVLLWSLFPIHLLKQSTLKKNAYTEG